MFWFSKANKAEQDSKNDKLNNVTINKDGIVKLNLRKKAVREKVALQALKFQKINTNPAS
jgi:hypothetical protein